MKDLLIGGHVSAAGGFKNVPERAHAIGANAIQIFGASPRAWRVKEPGPDDVILYKKGLSQAGVKTVYLHASYLVNLASPLPAAREKSRQNLEDHLRIATALGAQGLIFHLGSGKELPKERAIGFIATAMKKVLRNVPGSCPLVMENSAGGGAKIGSLPEDMAAILAETGNRRVKICIDTAHSLESGLIESYTPKNVARFADGWGSAVGIETIVAFHANDSKTPYNSHHDRHENIGEGYIGVAGFKALAHEKRFRGKAWLLEVPGFKGEGPDAKNVTLLKNCFR